MQAGVTRLIGLCLVTYALLPGSPASAAQVPGSLTLHVDNQKLTLLADNVEVRQLLEQVASRTGIRLWISEKLQAQTVTDHFEDLPMEAAFRRLLQHISHVLVFDEHGSISGLYVLPTGSAQPERLVYTPEVGDNTARILQEALKSDAIPDNIKAALLSQHNRNSNTSAKTIATQRLEVITQLVEKIEQSGQANSETVQRLREMLVQQRAKQALP